MSSEVMFQGPFTGSTCYFVVRGSGSAIWNTSGGTGALENFASGNWNNYAIGANEQGISNFFLGDMPLALPAGVWGVQAKQQSTASPLQTDRGIAEGDVNWNGSKAVPLSDLATSGQLGQLQPMRVARGVSLNNFPFYLVSSADHVTPFLSGSDVSGQISRDGGSFGPLQSGNVTEIGLGFYKVNLTSGDLLCYTAALQFQGTGVSGGTSDPRSFSLVTQRVSGSP